MVAILRKADGSIKTYAEKGEDFILSPGETMNIIEESFAEYSNRLTISAGGRSGETVTLPSGTQAVQVQVSCPGEISVALNINNEETEVFMVNGWGNFQLPLEDGKTYLISPCDRLKYCAAGEAILAVIVAGSDPE